MAFTDIFSGISETLGLTDFVSDLFTDIPLVGDFLTSGGTSSFASDILSGAITNAAISGIAGGDIGKAALYGAVGGAFSDSTEYGGALGQYGNEIGGAISGYGLGESLGGNGLLSAAGGALGAYAKDNNVFGGRSEVPDGNVTENPSVFNGDAEAVPGSTPVGAGGSTTSPIQNKLQQLGLIQSDGQGTLLGKGLLMGAAGMASQASTEDAAKQRLEDEKEYYRARSGVDAQAEQNRIAAFANPQFKVQRNG